MPMSVNTNKSALIALQNLTTTNEKLEQVQSRINTGLRVANAKDNAAVYAIAQKQRADFSSLSAVKMSLDRATSITDVAMTAGEQISDILIQMREKVVAATEDSATPTSRKAFDDEYQTLLQAISQFSSSAEFDGVSVLNGTLTAQLNFLANSDGDSFIGLTPQDFTISGSVIDLAGTVLTGTTTANKAVLASLNSAITNVTSALAEMGAESKQIEKHVTFVTKLQDVLETGIGNLVDADIAKESARLQALQVQQQLGAQALSIANSQPQVILQLFRGG
ncbi:flagellin [Phenylobacterium sp.]|uniref:flagellin n=1 Tax=Phenylobacterium sp. TaxID=1871053 RepID=UPI0010ED8EA7|nr:flagellin [Phenylobacterium sp.]MDP1598824.1 flagellin [Phenylobacterium sp.]MDP3594097.1 flagellin [Phenylobacterium sp.]RYG04627.1 MAG: flagellin [Caulobacteraceae bacterium]